MPACPRSPSRATAVPVRAGAGEVSAIGSHRLALNELLVATGHADGRVLLLHVATARCGVQHRVEVGVPRCARVYRQGLPSRARRLGALCGARRLPCK
jgi:hypothetical protein